MNDKARIHVTYVISILCVLIIILVTVQFGGISGLAELVAFGLTLTSLIVSLVAIVYSMISNANMVRTSGNLEDASERIEAVTVDLAKSSRDLVQHIDVLPPVLQGIEKRVQEGNQQITDLLKASNSGDASATDNVSEPPAIQFLEQASYNGLLALYACRGANRRNVSIDLETLFPGNKDYIHGFMVGCSPFGVVDYHTEGSLFIIDTVDGIVTRRLDDFLNTRILQLERDLPDHFSLSKMEASLKEIDKYLDERR